MPKWALPTPDSGYAQHLHSHKVHSVQPACLLKSCQAFARLLLTSNLSAGWQIVPPAPGRRHDEGLYSKRSVTSCGLQLPGRCGTIRISMLSHGEENSTQKDQLRNVAEIVDILDSDLSQFLRKEPNWDIFAEDFMVIDHTAVHQGTIRLEGVRHLKQLLKLLRKMSARFVEKDDIEVQFITDNPGYTSEQSDAEFLIACWRIKLLGVKLQLVDSGTPVDIEVETLFRLNNDKQIDSMRIDKWLVNGRRFQPWPEATVAGLRADIADILVREPRWEFFAKDFTLISQTLGTVKGLGPNKLLLTGLREFHTRLIATPLKDDFKVRFKKAFATDGTFEPTLVARWSFHIDQSSNALIPDSVKSIFRRIAMHAGFPLNVAGTSTFRFNAEGKVKYMTIDTDVNLLEWKYFAYGSNLNADVLSRRTGGRSVVRTAPQPAVLQNYSLVFNLGPPQGPAAASVEKCVGKACHGVVYTLDLQQFLAMLYSEGVPWGYSVEPVMVEPYSLDGAGGQHVRVRAYTLVSGRGLTSYPPSKRYRDLLVNGASANSLDTDWVMWLRSLDVASAPFGIR